MNFRSAIPAAGLVLLTACTGVGRPATDPRFIAVVRNFYNANAAENMTGCDAPLMVNLRALQNLGPTGRNDTVRMVASFDFEQRDRASGSLICSGEGTRYFTIFRSVEGLRVMGMSGARRQTG